MLIKMLGFESTFVVARRLKCLKFLVEMGDVRTYKIPFDFSFALIWNCLQIAYLTINLLVAKYASFLNFPMLKTASIQA